MVYLKGPTHQTPACLCCSVKALCPVPFLLQSSCFLLTVNAFTITHTLIHAHTHTAPSLEEYDCIMKDTTKKCKMSVCLCVCVYMAVSMEKLSLSSGKGIICQELSSPSTLSVSRSASQQFFKTLTVFWWFSSWVSVCLRFVYTCVILCVQQTHTAVQPITQYCHLSLF